MSHDEFIAWQLFYMQHPFDDLHRYHRPAALVSHSMSGIEIEDALKFLENQPETEQDSDASVFKAFGIKPPPKKD